MSEFLNPRSMITPGIAGAVMMFLVNGMSVPFPELPQRWLALGLSLLIGALVVLRQTDIDVVSRLGYWLLNSFVIFVVGFGSNNLAREAASAPPAIAEKSGAVEHHAALALLIPRAYAEDPPAAADAGKQGERSRADAEKLEAQVEALKAENARLTARLEKTADPKKQESRGAFFKKW